MRLRQLVPWLLTVGLGLVVFTTVWHLLELDVRTSEGGILKPDGVAWEPRETLIERIEATWVPGDLLRAVLLLTGVALCALASWRARRLEGLPPATLRKVALNLAILGVACLGLGVFRARTHPPVGASWNYVPASTGGLGVEHLDGIEAPVGLVPLLGVGGAWLGLGVLLWAVSLLHGRRRRKVARHVGPARKAEA